MSHNRSMSHTFPKNHQISDSAADVLISCACCIKCTKAEVGRNIFVGGENGQSAKNARLDSITLSCFYQSVKS
jgi:hypothetical protein